MTYPLSFEATTIICFILGAGLIVSLCVLVGAIKDDYKDEITRFSIRAGVGAALLIFFLIIIFTYPACANCGKKTNTDYCTSCGIIIKENITPVCPECDKVCYTNFCGSCGTEINQED